MVAGSTWVCTGKRLEGGRTQGAGVAHPFPARSLGGIYDKVISLLGDSSSWVGGMLPPLGPFSLVASAVANLWVSSQAPLWSLTSSIAGITNSLY